MGLTHTPESKVMAVWICRELSFSISTVSIYYVPKWISEWNIMTISITRELSLFIFERVDIWWALHIHPSQKLWSFEYAESFVFNFLRPNILCARIGDLREKLWPFEFLKSFHGSFSSASKYHGPHTYTQVKSYGCSNFLRASMYNFESLDILWAWIGHPSEKLWPFWISWDLPLFVFEPLVISCASYIHQSQKLWPFEFAESFRVKFEASRYIMCLNRTS